MPLYAGAERNTGVKKRRDRNGIQIRPAHVVCYFVQLLILLFLYFFLKSHILLTVVVLLAVLPICSVWSAWRMQRDLSVTVWPMQEVLREGEEGIWRIRIHNDSYGLALSCRLFGTAGNTFLGTSGEIKLEMPISMKYTEYMDLPLGAQYCGLVRVEIHAIEYMDPMALVRVRIPVEVSGESVILPDTQADASEQREGYQAGISEAEETLSKGHDFSEVTDMREYRPGDRIKDIHWKLSAKKQDLMVKERASVAQSQVVLVLDLSDEYEMVSRIVGAAYGISGAFLEIYVPVRVLWWDEQSYTFREILISGADALEDGFGKLMHGHACRVSRNLPELMQRVHPAYQSYVYLHRIQEKADGEVISHA